MQRFHRIPFVLLFTAAIAAGQTTTRVSVATDGTPGNGRSGEQGEFDLVSVSANGRWVAFNSVASNLVPDDTNRVLDVFLRDREDGMTTRVSQSSFGTEGNAASGNFLQGISADGRYVAFGSNASNLVPRDANGRSDVFVHDRVTGATICASVDASGRQGAGDSWSPVLSADGRYVAFESLAALVPGPPRSERDVLVHDRDADGNGIFDEPGGISTARVSADSADVPGNGSSYHPSISASGRFVAFESYASNLASGAPGTTYQIFLRDRDADGNGVFDEPGLSSTIRVDFGPGGSPANGWSLHPWLSADARFVSFHSDATNLVAGDQNGARDVFVEDLATGTTSRVSVDSQGREADAASQKSALSADGRYVVFTSLASNLVTGDGNGVADVFLHDRSTGSTTRASVALGAADPDGASVYPAISADGAVVVFTSAATDLVAGDAGGVEDVFAVVRATPEISSVAPSIGPSRGGDVVRVSGADLAAADPPRVAFGGAAAEVLEWSPASLVVRTPPGDGIVDVTVTARGVAGRLAAAYRYVPASLAARYGDVNRGVGDYENVLLVNGEAGDPVTRELTIGVRTPLDAVMVVPSTRRSSRFALYAWNVEPTPETLQAQRRGVGLVVLPTPLDAGARPQPIAVLNNFDPRLGAPTAASTPAPSRIGRLPRGIGRAAVVTLQGFIQDDGSRIPEHVSVTNAIVLRIQ
jgi:IPT/TIG domain-containing protein